MCELAPGLAVGELCLTVARRLTCPSAKAWLREAFRFSWPGLCFHLSVGRVRRQPEPMGERAAAPSRPEAERLFDRPAWAGLGAGILVLGGAVASVERSGLADAVDVERLRALIEGWGALGPAVFLVGFAAGALLHLPGYLFVTAAVLVYGPMEGGALSFAAAWAYDGVTFLALRRFSGGRPRFVPPGLVDRIRRSRWWTRIHRSPLTTTAALRSALPTNLALTWVLAAGRVSPRAHLLGSAIGILPQLGVTVGVAASVVVRLE